jgi:hypothetical protein
VIWTLMEAFNKVGEGLNSINRRGRFKDGL